MTGVQTCALPIWTALRACFTSGVHVHTSTVPPPPQTLPHSVSALLFDETGRHVQGPLRPRPSRAPRAAGTLTPLVGLQLRFQVLGGHVELGLLALGRLGLALPAAAVEAAAEAAAAVAAGEEPAEHEQGLGAGDVAVRRGRDAALTRPPPPPGSQRGPHTSSGLFSRSRRIKKALNTGRQEGRREETRCVKKGDF